MPVASRRRDRPNDAEAFVDELRSIAPLRALWLPAPSDTTSTLREGRTWTNSASNAGRVSYRGNGILVSFASASSQAVETADTDDLSFNTGGLTDLPFSAVFFGAVTNAAALRGLIGKRASSGSLSEYLFYVNDTSGRLSLLIRDQSAGVQCIRNSDATVPLAANVLLGASYSGVGGASAGDGIALYENGAVKASSASNNASYVAMENTAAPLTIANDAITTGRFLEGSAGFAAIYAAALTAAQHRRIADLCRDYWEVSL
jgi:hypothetical protein